MTTMLALYNSDGCAGRCDARCYNAKSKTCSCICGGVNHGVGRQQAIDQTREYLADLPNAAKQNARPDETFRTITVLPKTKNRGPLPHPNQSLLFYLPPMNAVTKQAALAASLAAIAALLTGCPTPPPPPPPIIVARIVVVYESHDLTPTDAATLNSKTLRHYLDAHGYWFRFIDQDIKDPELQPPAEILPYITAAQNKHLPWLLFADASHNVTAGQHLPPTDADVINLLETKQQ
jgi:hypothetical protein